MPPPAVRAYLKVIEAEPEGVARAVGETALSSNWVHSHLFLFYSQELTLLPAQCLHGYAKDVLQHGFNDWR